ncbi:hypothetical protein M8J77_022770 [Diaphorina citri]|nr:hypothetical protein M8J77_022770 [Diaphorina citri]
MEIIPEGKNFNLVPHNELPELLNFLSKRLPDSLKFHQTLRTFLNDKVYDFHFYISKSWPEDPICLHFPGMTKSLWTKREEKTEKKGEEEKEEEEGGKRRRKEEGRKKKKEEEEGRRRRRKKKKKKKKKKQQGIRSIQLPIQISTLNNVA